MTLRKLQKPFTQKYYRNVFYKKVIHIYTNSNKVGIPQVTKLGSDYNIVLCSPNLEQTDSSVFVQILIFTSQKLHTIEITYSGQHLHEWTYLNARGFFGTTCITNKASTATVTLEEKTWLWKVLNIEKQNRHKEKQKSKA